MKKIVFLVFLITSISNFLLSQSIRSSKDENCPECKKNEYAAIAEYFVGPGDYVYVPDPPCAGSHKNVLSILIRSYADLKIPGISSYAGPILDKFSSKMGEAINTKIRSSFGKFSSYLTNPRANCRIIAVAIPSGSKYTGYRLYSLARNGSGWGNVKVGQDCEWSKFETEPRIEWTGNGGIVWTIYKNWSHNLTRGVRIEAFFIPPKDWAPPR
jgi:hypothetical protein